MVADRALTMQFWIRRGLLCSILHVRTMLNAGIALYFNVQARPTFYSITLLGHTVAYICIYKMRWQLQPVKDAYCLSGIKGPYRTFNRFFGALDKIVHTAKRDLKVVNVYSPK